MSITRRDFVQQSAAAAAAVAAGAPLPGLGQNVVTDAEAAKLKWSKAPCRFCGVGCGVQVGVRDNRVVATQADAQAEVNRGVNCVKGYYLAKIMYGADRLTRPLLRMKNGRYDKNGEFAPVSWDRAFDAMAGEWKRVLREKGPTAVGMFGSGQWTIWEGYAAAKLMKGGFRTNNIDPNARHCMASAVAAFMRTFGMDEPMGCYDDIEHADAFVLWGANMAEMHPILWTRVTDRRLSHPKTTKVAVLSVFEHRCFDLADLPIVFTPQTDLAIANYIGSYIIRTKRVNRDFVDRHTAFRLGNTDIGYGLRPDHPLQKAAKNAGDAGGAKVISFDDFANFVARYDAPYVTKLTGVPKGKLDALAELYADPKIKVMSFWTMGFNQHTRGVWANQLVYNLHLLTGKIATPGNSPFSLSERAIRELEQALVRYLAGGDTEFPAFAAKVKRFVDIYFEHMRKEEELVLPCARAVFTAADWEEIAAGFAGNADPLSGVQASPDFRALFARIMNIAPPPVGVGPEM